MIEALMEEAFATGEMMHECPDFDTHLEMARHLVGILYIAGKNDRGDFYRKVLGL